MAVNELHETPKGSRFHMGIFGRTNSGKSTLVNALSGQEAALVSPVAGTTTDPVFRSIELLPIGPCVLIDTAGFDDNTELGALRQKRTEEILAQVDLALLVLTGEQTDFSSEQNWLERLNRRKFPVIVVINIQVGETAALSLPQALQGYPTVMVNAKTGKGMDTLKAALMKHSPVDFELPTITGHLVGQGDHVLLVMPQDTGAPKGRLILPQVQTIRDLLDLGASVSSCTTEQLKTTLGLFKTPPKLIITDSQVFSKVAPQCPKESMLTSFSVLMARYKGDIVTYLEGAKAIEQLKPNDRVLILEACTHNPQDGDIGRVKLPNMLSKKVGGPLQVTICSGNDIPGDLSAFALVIHCGGCMFNRAHVLSRIAGCKAQRVPITNYGIAIAKLLGILEQVTV